MSVCGSLGGRTKFHFVMKKKNFLWLIAFALLMPLFALTACSDDDDGDNDSTGDKTEQTTNDGTAQSTGEIKILPKKVIKIYDTRKDSGYEGSDQTVYSYDSEGKLVSKVRGDVYIEKYTYTDESIVVERTGKHDHDNYTTIYTLKNGRIVSEDKGDEHAEYTYSSEYISTVKEEYETTYTFSNGNLISYESTYGDDFQSCTYKYGNKLNNLNVDIFFIGAPNGYYGKRVKNLPESSRGISTDSDQVSSSSIYEYKYEGDYVVQFTEVETRISKSGSEKVITHTYDIYYE